MTTEQPKHGCEEFAELISAYFDQQLDPDQLQDVEQHLEQCESCRKRLRDYQQIRDAVLSRKAPPTPNLAETLIEKLERDQLLSGLGTLAEPPTTKGVRFLRALAAAAVICLITSATLLMINVARRPSPRQTPLVKAPADRREGLQKESDESNEPFAALAEKPKSNISSDRLTAPKPALRLSRDVKREDVERTAGRSAAKDTEARMPLAARPTGESAVGVSDQPTDRITRLLHRRGETIQIRADDPPTWMLFRGRLVTTLTELGMVRVQPGEMAQQLDKGQTDLFAFLPRTAGTSAERYHCQLVLATDPTKQRRLRAAIEAIPTQSLALRGQSDLKLDVADDLRSRTEAKRVPSRRRTAATGPAAIRAYIPSQPTSGPTSTALLVIELTTKPVLTTTRVTTAPQTSSAPATSTAPAEHQRQSEKR